MMWNLVSSTSDDETITNVFYTNELFKLTSEAQVTEQPAVQAVVRNGRMVISVNNNLFLLENDNTIECNSVCFESPIEAMELSSNGSFVVCGLRDGSIHGFHIQGNQVFNIAIGEEDILQTQTFIGISQTPRNNYIVMCSSGSVYRLSNIDELNSSEMTVNNSETPSADSTKIISVEVQQHKISQKTCEAVVNSFCVVSDEYGDTIVSSCKNFIHIQRDKHQHKIKLPKLIESVKAIYYLEHFLIGLSSNGEMFEICLFSNTIHRLPHLDYFVDNIVILQITDNEIQLLLQTQSIESKTRNLKIVDFPSMVCHSDIPTTQNTHLVQQSKSSVNMYYLEEAQIENAIPQQIVMKLVGETQPSERLKKLIHTGHLDKAEDFAKQFKLSNQPIHEARVKKIIIEISSIAKANTKLIKEKHNILLDLIKNITSQKFLLSLRFIECTDKDTIKKILFFLLENVNFQKHEFELGDIKEQLLRLDTLQLIDPYEALFEWQSFVNHPNLFKIIASWMNKNIDIACFIWKRHSSSFISHTNFESTMKTESLEPPQAIQWYRHFVPMMIQTRPETMPYLVDNAIEKTRTLQYSDKWPEIGLIFINEVFSIFSEVKFLFSDAKRDFDDCICKLTTIVMVLQDLSVLKRSYSLTFMYDDYVNNTVEENAFQILLRVRLNHLKDLTTDFLYPIFFEKGLSPIDTIIRYITFLVKGHKNIGFWEERAVAAIDLVYNVEQKLECALSVLRVATVPWSEAVAPLLKLGTSSHPLAAEIYNEYESQSLKIMKIKYGWEINSPGSILKLAFRIIKMNPERIDDIRFLVKVDSTQAFAINSYYIQALLQQNRIEECTEYMSYLHDAECKDVFEFICSIEDDFLNNNECIREFYKYIEQRKVNEKWLIKIATSRQNLRAKFQLVLTPTDFNDINIRRDSFEKGIEIILNNLKMKDTNILPSTYGDVILLCNSLNFEPMVGIFELSRAVDNIYFTCGMTKLVLKLVIVTEHNYSYFVDLAVLLIGQQIRNFELAQVSDSNTYSYPLAHHLLQKSLKYGNLIYQEINELLSWSYIGCDIYSLTEIENFLEAKEEFNKNMLHFPLDESFNVSQSDSFSVFESVNVVRSVGKPSNYNEEVLKCLSSAIHLICTLNLDNSAFNRINYYFEFRTDSKEEITDTFMASLEELITKIQHSIAFKITQLILKYQKLSNFIIIKDSYATNINRKIVKYALQRKNPKYLDLTAVIMSDGNPQALVTNLESQLKNSPYYLNYLKLCAACNAIIPTFHVDLESRSIITFQYYNELCMHDPSLKSTNVNIQSFDDLLGVLKNKVLPLSLLKKLSEAFDWNYQEILVTQILTILSTQELEYVIDVDVFGNEEVIFKNAVEPLYDLCESYINELTSTSDLAEQLYSYMKTINFYFYELFLCIIDILDHIKAMRPDMNWWRSILKFLKHKMTSKRDSPIGQMENDAWLASHPLTGVPPQIAKYRLPFLLMLGAPLKDLLNDEIKVEDYDRWFPLIEICAHMYGGESTDEISSIKDMFCMQAVKNSTSEHRTIFKNESVNYNLQPMNNEFLQSILRLIKKMKDESKILFLLYFTSNQAPEGADQVEASYECYKFAIENEVQISQNRRGAETVLKIKRKYPIYKTKHLLYLYGLMEDKLVQLIEYPEELISALYRHDCILKQRKLDMNKLAEEIAGLHNKTLKEIQLKILQKWFMSAINNGNLADETFCGDLDTSNHMNDDPIIEGIPTRVCYILNQWEPDDAQEFCVRHIYDDQSTAKQLLAFECYIKLSNNDKELFESDKFIAVKCVYYLNQLGFKITVAKFSECNKIDILKKIWSKYASDTRALELISFISIAFNIYIPKLWNGVLKQMVTLKMLNQLSAIIELISKREELRRIDDGLVEAWHYLIKEPFENANKSRSSEQEARLRKSLFLCQTCPVISKIDLNDIARQFVYLERCHMAAVLLVFLKEHQKIQTVEMIKKNAPQSLKDEIISLANCGIYSFVIDLAITELEL